MVQLDEPALPGVLAGRVPTASGFGRHRSVEPPEASAALGWVLDAIREEGAEPWVHCCAPDAPLGLLRDAGARGLAVDPDLLGAAGHDVLATALEAGDAVALGVVPTTGATEGTVTEAVLRWLDMVGLEPGDSLLVSPSCGLAGASGAAAHRALAMARAGAAELG